MMPTRANPPLALIACGDPHMSRALVSVFQQHGYDSAPSTTGAETLKLARLVHHDVLVLDESIEDSTVLDVCRRFRDGALFDHTVPVVVTSPAPLNHDARLAAYAAGAWEYCSTPANLEILFIKLQTFVRARKETARVQAEVFVNAATGLYTSFGLRQLAGKFGARAVRKHEPFACVAFSPQEHDREVAATNVLGASPSRFTDVAHVFRVQSRQSDIVGHMSESRLAILAPDTDADGAKLLVARLQRELDRAAENKAIRDPVKLRAGYSAVSDLAASNLSVAELVNRAERALSHTPQHADDATVLNFDDIPRF